MIWRATLAGVLALTAAACGKPGAGNAVEANAAGAGIPSSTVLDPTVPRAATAVAPITGSFVAVSNTAMSITGDVTIAAESLSFGLDQRYATGAIVASTGDGTYAGTERWADLFGVSPDTPVEIRSVTSGQVGAKARNGGLCGTAATRYVAIARKAPGTPDELLQIAAFQGAAAPGKAATTDSLCGTFTYMPGPPVQK